MGVGIFILAICACFFCYPWVARLGERLGQWVSDRNQARIDKDRRYMAEVRRTTDWFDDAIRERYGR